MARRHKSEREIECGITNVRNGGWTVQKQQEELWVTLTKV